MNTRRRHFHTFDAFRFFSFLLVFLHHTPIPESSFLVAFSKSGGIGVSFFFVLSGFLITYILMHEKLANKKINLKNFFVRRVLRIWPLFYAMILFAFLTPYILKILNLSYSDEGYSPQWLYSVLFLENYKMMLTDSFPNVSPLRVMWSLCVEEHFYIIWGIILYFIPIKKIPQLIVLCILIANVTRIIYNHFAINTLDIFSNIDYFAYGAIPAYILLMRNEVLEKLNEYSVSLKQLFLLLATAIIFIIPNIQLEWFNLFSPTILGVLFSALIATTLSTNNSLHISDNYVVGKLGKYTYGLYLYHVIVINLLLQTIKASRFDLNWIFIGVASLIMTIFISISSYYLFENPLLKLKKYFY